MIARLRVTAQEAMEQGFKALRIAGDRYSLLLSSSFFVYRLFCFFFFAPSFHTSPSIMYSLSYRYWTFSKTGEDGRPAMSESMRSKVMKYELEINSVIEENPFIISLCMYDRRNFSENSLLEV